MNGNEILRIVDAIHRDKNIDKEIVFEGIEQAIASAARKHFGEESEIAVSIDRTTGEPSATVDGTALESDEIGDLLGRIAAQTAKQVMIQKIREAERDALYEEYSALRGHLVSGTITQVTPGAATVNLGKVEGLLPRSERIPGETHRVGERIRAIVLEVKKAGSRVKIILSRTHPEMVRRLFELEIPEIAEHVIEVRSLAREAGYRSKVAVSCYDNKIDCVGACVGVRGSRIKNIVEELAGERIDIVRWNDSLQVLVPNALQPAEVEDVILCPMLGKVIVLVREDQLSLSIGKKGQNVRLASKLVGWDIHVLTQEKLDELLDTAVEAFSKVPGISEELAENLVAQGFFTFEDLSVIEPDQLAELGNLTPEECAKIIAYADVEAEKQEQEELRAAAEARELRRREAALAQMEESLGITPPQPAPPEKSAAPEESEAISETSETQTGEETAAEAETAEEAEPQPPAGEAAELAAVMTEPTAEETIEETIEETAVPDTTAAETLPATTDETMAEVTATATTAAAATAAVPEKEATDKGPAAKSAAEKEEARPAEEGTDNQEPAATTEETETTEETATEESGEPAPGAAAGTLSAAETSAGEKPVEEEPAEEERTGVATSSRQETASSSPETASEAS